jgi:regulatory protein
LCGRESNEPEGDLAASGMTVALCGMDHERPCRDTGPPNAKALHEAALQYLSRYAASEASLRRVLIRRIDRWASRARGQGDDEAIAGQVAAAHAAARDVVARLAAAGAVNDAAYAESRALSLMRSGRSRRAVAAHLAAKGVDPALARSVLPADEWSELAAALVLARKRRIGPFRTTVALDEAGRRRELGILARAGFDQPLARQALGMDPGQAEGLVARLRR